MYFFIVTRDNKNIGFLNIVINNIGMFDIGLCSEYRGNWYSKELLETAINFLIKKSSENIEVIVIEKIN